MAIAVDHHDIVWRHGVVPNHFVGGAGAVGHKEAVVRIEDTRRVAFALANCAVVVEQLTEFFYRVAHVSTQHVLTIKLVVHLAYGAFQERYAA